MKLFAAILCVLLLSACGTNPAMQELAKNDAGKATAKVEAAATNAPAATAAPSIKPTPVPTPTPKADIWTYYNDAKWADDFKGLKSSIDKVVVSDKAPNQENNGKTFDASAVGIKFKIENTTEGLFTSYPDQARLVTSTGEQIESPEMFLSDDLGGEIEKGVVKEGNIIWYLKRGHAEDVKWIKLKWDASTGDGLKMDDERKQYSIQIDLKK